ncbi:hypothetical protein E3N88_37143 [Mikania micrantha]|uniref:Uncharacterized protein n=1 Tax=Mikania micrantha TaxID=192012 RepID=A0A5N6M8D0_9ASTR|nr:hypothetical protein E3N88_37143 [Mikania micrantha]
MSKDSKNKKIVLTNQPSSSSSSSLGTPLPINNRFAPISPFSSRPRSLIPIVTPNPISFRPPYSSVIQTRILPPSITNISKTPIKNSNPSSSSDSSLYSINPNSKVVKILEPIEEEKVQHSFLTLIDFLYPRNCHFYDNEYKTIEYYQPILVDTGSVDIQHILNSQNPSKIDYSKIKIRKVITLEEWKSKPFVQKTLSNFHSYPQYNDYDYQEAWEKALLFRNFNHSWFIYYDDQFSNNYPRWFIKWFKYMGIIPDAFPKEISIAYNKFIDYFKQDGTPDFEYTLQFMTIFRIPWIFSWTYHYQVQQNISPPLLLRHYRSKWWNKFSIAKANVSSVQNYYRSITSQHERSIKSPVNLSLNTFEDQDYIIRLQSCSTLEEMQRIISEIKKNSPSQSKNSNTDDNSQDPYEDIGPI